MGGEEIRGIGWGLERANDASSISELTDGFASAEELAEAIAVTELFADSPHTSFVGESN